MQLNSLVLLLVASTSVFALPEPEAAKKTKTKTKTTATPSPTTPTLACAGQPFNQAQCSASNVGCLCYGLDLTNILNPGITIGTCSGAGVR